MKYGEEATVEVTQAQAIKTEFKDDSNAFYTIPAVPYGSKTVTLVKNNTTPEFDTADIYVTVNGGTKTKVQESVDLTALSRGDEIELTLPATVSSSLTINIEEHEEVKTVSVTYTSIWDWMWGTDKPTQLTSEDTKLSINFGPLTSTVDITGHFEITDKTKSSAGIIGKTDPTTYSHSSSIISVDIPISDWSNVDDGDTLVVSWVDDAYNYNIEYEYAQTPIGYHVDSESSTQSITGYSGSGASSVTIAYTADEGIEDADAQIEIIDAMSGTTIETVNVTFTASGTSITVPISESTMKALINAKHYNISFEIFSV